MEILHKITPLSKFLAIILFVTLPFVGFLFGVQYQKGMGDSVTLPIIPDPEIVACTLDATVCPDGSSVGRIPPNCEFAACPSSNDATSIDKNNVVENARFLLTLPEGWTSEQSQTQSNYVKLEKGDYSTSILFPLEGTEGTSVDFYPVKKELANLDGMQVELVYSLGVERCLIKDDKTEFPEICQNNFDQITVVNPNSERSAYFSRGSEIGSISFLSRMPIHLEYVEINSGIKDFKSILSAFQF